VEVSSGVVEANALLTTLVGELITFVISNRQGRILHGKLFSRFSFHINIFFMPKRVSQPGIGDSHQSNSFYGF